MGISKPENNNEAFDVSAMDVFGLLLAKFPFISIFKAVPPIIFLLRIFH